MSQVLQFWANHIESLLPQYEWRGDGSERHAFLNGKQIGGYSLNELMTQMSLGSDAAFKFSERVVKTLKEKPSKSTAGVERALDLLPLLWDAGFTTKQQGGKWWLYDVTGEAICLGDNFRNLCENILYWHSSVMENVTSFRRASGNDSAT
jgi:hypothetical protein